MVPTNVKTVYQTSFHHNIESNFDRLGLSCRLPTPSVLSNRAGKSRSNELRSKRPRFPRPHVNRQKKEKNATPRSMAVQRPLSREAGARASIQQPKAFCIPEKHARNFARSPHLVGPWRKKIDHVDQRAAFPPGTSRFEPLVLAHKG